MLLVPAAFTLPTTLDHWATLLRARAIENQCFVVAANQIGEHAPGLRSGGRSMIVDPWGLVLAQAADTQTVITADLDLDRQDDIRRRLPALDGPPAGGLPPARRGGHGLMATRNPQQAAEKRRLILDAAVRVFARQGFHTCRVSDIADEAGVAYGLVYHYFRSKDEVLDTLFLERWGVLLEAIREVDGNDAITAREKLHAIASFIVDSYRHDQDLMKVIIVEVTRAANSFGREHLAQIREAYDLIAVDRREGPGVRGVQGHGHAGVRRDGVLRRDRAGADRLDLRPAARCARGLRRGQVVRRRDDLRRPGQHAGEQLSDRV